MSKIGINGFGRIGRLVLRRLLEVKATWRLWPLMTSPRPKFSPIC